ncbi:MAG: flavodoxin family protein [Lachnospiraceae bacterium]|nr:flavodoxin family protein [Lachnospiraceae bacterium]
MKYSIVYSSVTGNTRLLAEQLKEVLPEADCVYYGAPDEQAAEAELIFAGFWTDKGNCDEGLASFLAGLQDKKVFLFGTAGFGGSEPYFEQILGNVRTHLNGSNAVVGTYMCQGRMPVAVRKRYEAMQPGNSEKMQGLIDNFDKALSHPDEADFEHLRQCVEACWNQM